MGRSADSPEFQHFARPAETVELPVTPAMAELFAREVRADTKRFPIIALVALALLLIAGVFLYLLLPLGGFLAIWLTLVFVWLVLVLVGAWTWRNARRNRRAGTFLRRRGLLRPTRSSDSQGYPIYWLHVGEHNFRVSEANDTAATGVGYGTVDYTKYGHEIIELRDSEERVRYRTVGYSPAETATGGAPQPA